MTVKMTKNNKLFVEYNGDCVIVALDEIRNISCIKIAGIYFTAMETVDMTGKGSYRIPDNESHELYKAIIDKIESSLI